MIYKHIGENIEVEFSNTEIFVLQLIVSAGYRLAREILNKKVGTEQLLDEEIDSVLFGEEILQVIKDATKIVITIPTTIK